MEVKMKIEKIIISLISTILFIIMTSCGSTAPFAEREAAFKSIDLAKSVDAEKYASDEFNRAMSEYDSGESLIVKEGKSSKNNEAKDKYLEADKQAQAAYTNSVRPYIESFIQKTDEEIEKARSIKSDIAVPEQFKDAISKNEQASDALNNENYDQAKISSLEAYDTIQQAQAETLELKEQAMEMDATFAEALVELKEKKAEAAIPDEYKNVVASYEDIHVQFKEGYYVEVIELYLNGILETDDLLTLIEKKRLLALESLQEAEESVEKAKMKASKAGIE